MGEKNRHSSREFKRDAVQVVAEKGLPVGKVARELDIHPSLLHIWRRRFLAKGEKAFVGKGRVTPEEAEIKGLRKELEKVREVHSQSRRLYWSPRIPAELDERGLRRGKNRLPGS